MYKLYKECFVFMGKTAFFLFLKFEYSFFGLKEKKSQARQAVNLSSCLEEENGEENEKIRAM